MQQGRILPTTSILLNRIQAQNLIRMEESKQPTAQTEPV
jgi:hypothetical protein